MPSSISVGAPQHTPLAGARSARPHNSIYGVPLELLLRGGTEGEKGREEEAARRGGKW